MSHIWSLIKKELRELLTPTTIIPLILMVLLFSAIGPLAAGQSDKASQPMTVGVMNADDTTATSYSALAHNWIYDANSGNAVDISASLFGDNDAISKAMQDADIKILFVITPGYSQTIIDNMDTLITPPSTPIPTTPEGWKQVQGQILTYWYQGSGSGSDLSSSTATNILSYVRTMTSAQLIHDYGGLGPYQAAFAMYPVSTNSVDNNNFLILSTGVWQGYTPDMISSSQTVQKMLMSIVMMIIIIMIGSILISSMGNEKENKTLETLLTLPVSRTTVVGGKIIGSAIVGILFGAVYLIGMYFGLGKSMTSGSVDLSKIGLALSPLDWLVVGVFLFLAIVCALGICMILGAFAKNYKAAQTLIMPISILAVVSMVLNLIGGFGSLPRVLNAVMFVIPFSHPMMAINNLMFGDTVLLAAGFIYLLAFALVTLAITVRLYKSDILLTGFIKTGVKKDFFTYVKRKLRL